MHAHPDQTSRLRLSMAACALVVATTTAEPSDEAVGSVPAAVERISDSTVLKKVGACCTRSWMNAGIDRQEWDDSTQEVYLQLLTSLGCDRIYNAIEAPDSDERRDLNRAIWATSQRRRRARRYTSLIDDVVKVGDVVKAVETDPWPAKMESLRQVRKAIDSPDVRLSPTQQEIVTRWSKGESISGIANEMKLSPARVSDEKYKAIQKLRAHLAPSAE